MLINLSLAVVILIVLIIEVVMIEKERTVSIIFELVRVSPLKEK